MANMMDVTGPLMITTLDILKIVPPESSLSNGVQISGSSDGVTAKGSSAFYVVTFTAGKQMLGTIRINP
jgi:hypothetical protein